MFIASHYYYQLPKPDMLSHVGASLSIYSIIR